jgi:hypothetical protein
MFLMQPFSSHIYIYILYHLIQRPKYPYNILTLRRSSNSWLAPLISYIQLPQGGTYLKMFISNNFLVYCIFLFKCGQSGSSKEEYQMDILKCQG